MIMMTTRQRNQFHAQKLNVDITEVNTNANEKSNLKQSAESIGLIIKDVTFNISAMKCLKTTR